MLIPLDPSKISACWKKLEHSLLENDFTCIIHAGKKCFDSLNHTKKKHIEKIIHEMQQADYVRLGSNRTILIPAHFAIKFLSYHKATLCELVSLNASEEIIKNDLTLAIQFAFFENPNLAELIIPLIIKDIHDENIKIEINEVNQQMIIKRANFYSW